MGDSACLQHHAASYGLRVDTTQAKDKICKRLFRHRRLVADLLRVHVSGRWVREVDFRTLRLMPTEFVGRAGDRRFGDVLWVASLRDGRQVMVMIEIQSVVDSDMAARMAAYVGMVYESLTPAARGTNDRYPAIFPLVVYTGNAEWRAADDLRDVADPVHDLAGHIAGRRYVRLDLGLLPRDDLQNDRLSVLAQLTGGRSLSDMVPVLSKAAHGDDWWGAVPEGIRVDCATKKERERESAGQDIPPQAYLTFIDLRTIIEKNWQTFGSLMEDISGRKGKRSATSWMVEVNELRNRWAHPIKQRFVETAPMSISRLQGYLQALQTVHTP